MVTFYSRITASFGMVITLFFPFAIYLHFSWFFLFFLLTAGDVLIFAGDGGLFLGTPSSLGLAWTWPGCGCGWFCWFGFCFEKKCTLCQYLLFGCMTSVLLLSSLYLICLYLLFFEFCIMKSVMSYKPNLKLIDERVR